MGMTFSSVQVRTGGQKTLEQVKSTLLQYLKTQDLVLADADTEHFTYILALSENGEWLTVCRSDYSQDAWTMKKDSEKFLRAFKTCCIETNVVDSDMLIFNLSDYKTGSDDAIIIGGEGYGTPLQTGKQKFWESHLKDEVTWERFQNALQEGYVFVEEVLWKVAPLLGMEGNIIANGYSELDSMEHDNPNITMLYLKSAKSKARGLATVFKQVYGEKLIPRGFVKLKSRQPYFIRVIGNEIIQVVTIMDNPCGDRDMKDFLILCGIATVYRHEIDFSRTPFLNSLWLSTPSEMYYQLNQNIFNRDRRDDLRHYYYLINSEEDLISELERSFEAVKEIVLPQFDKITDIESCIEYFSIFNSSLLKIYGDNDFGVKQNGGPDNEGLLYIKIGREKYIEKKEWLRLQIFAIDAKKRNYSAETIKKLQEIFWGTPEKRFAAYNKIFDDTEWCEKARAELERRKAKNIETLRGYGFSIGD